MVGRPKGHPKTGGRKKGSQNLENRKMTPRDARTLARAEALRQELEDHKPSPGTELAKEILGKFAHNCAAVTMKLWPAFQENGEPVPRFKGHMELWVKMMDFTLRYANGASPYQSPTFRAITVVPPPVDRAPGDDAVVIDLKIFENTGTAVALLDEMAEKAKR